MPRWIHRTSKRVLNSMSPASLPEAKANYIREPDLSSVEGQPVRYWVISGDVVSLMDRSARDAADAALNSEQLDGIVDELTNPAGRSLMRAAMAEMVSMVNQLRNAHGQPPITADEFKAAVRARL